MVMQRPAKGECLDSPRMRWPIGPKTGNLDSAADLGFSSVQGIFPILRSRYSLVGNCGRIKVMLSGRGRYYTVFLQFVAEAFPEQK
jgi:hypothetical protein